MTKGFLKRVDDDARLFGEDPAYPSIRDLTSLILIRRPDARVTVLDDMFRATPAYDLS